LAQATDLSVTGLLRFYSRDELRRYLKLVVESYQLQNQKFGDQLGGLLRVLEQEKAAAKAVAKDTKAHADPKTPTKGWVKMGTIMVNTSDPGGALAEVLYQLHEDVKAKLAKAGDAVKSFEEMSSATIPEAGMYYLQVRNGIPERVVVDLQRTKRDAFSFTADFQLV